MFRKAQRRQSKLRLALSGPSGSGKTYSGLLIAKGLVGEGGRVALVDTEHGSGELYSHLLEYDVAPLDAPYSPARYIEAIQEAEQAGYAVLVIDSLSQAWSGVGGVLEMHDQAAAAVRNSFAAWREVTPEHNRLVETILASPLHIIGTMRTKTAYEVQSEGGKNKVVKVGLAPVQRDGVEYEFTTVLDLSVEGHVATASKDRTGLFDGTHFVPGEDTGQQLQRWLSTGEDWDRSSARKAAELIGSLEQIEAVPHLKNWGNKHADEIGLLTAHHQDQVRQAFSQHRAALAA